MTNPIVEQLTKVLEAEKIRLIPIVRSQAAKWKVDLVNLLAKILKVDITPDIQIEKVPHVPANKPTVAAKSVTKAKAKRKK